MEAVSHPAVAWVLFVTATWLWHVPRVYDLALRSSSWHYLQHACFLGTGLLFWYPVVLPYPARQRWSAWLMAPYLLLADIQNTALSALLAFSDWPIYGYYDEMPRIGGLSAVEDQSAAGAIMWVPGSLAYLVPLFLLSLRLLYGQKKYRVPSTGHRAPRNFGQGRIALPLLSTSPGHGRFDILRLPLLGAFLRWRHARLVMQLALFVPAGMLIFDGLTGPQIGAMNLAGVLPWIHWRGLLILGLLVAGNVFCMACPFLLPRTLARRWLPANRSWPRPLRSKWLAVLLLVVFLWAYEAFALWDSPWWTAWLALAYFAGALVVDGFFRGGSFCKYVCPIGQFNFVQSLMSPFEIKVRDPAVCADCRTKDCIRGRDGIPGCELNLYQPRKAGNLDCTFCLDCIHACPHDNLGIEAETPCGELWLDRQRSGIGRFSRRPDLAALVIVLVFGAFTNAAGMIAPVVDWEDRLAELLGLSSPALSVSIVYLLGLVILPALTVSVAAACSRAWGRLGGTIVGTATRFSYALAPLGFGMWLTHYCFHFFTSYDTIVPAAQRFLSDQGWQLAGTPEWVAACCRSAGDWLLRLEILFLDFGLLLSLYACYRIALSQSARASVALRALTPWAILLILLFVTGVWIVLQPMQMRGTLGG
jgi:ferredoxin